MGINGKYWFCKNNKNSGPYEKLSNPLKLMIIYYLPYVLLMQ